MLPCSLEEIFKAAGHSMKGHATSGGRFKSACGEGGLHMLRYEASLTVQLQKLLEQAITISTGRFLVPTMWQAEPRLPRGLPGTRKASGVRARHEAGRLERPTQQVRLCGNSETACQAGKQRQKPNHMDWINAQGMKH